MSAHVKGCMSCSDDVKRQVVTAIQVRTHQLMTWVIITITDLSGQPLLTWYPLSVHTFGTIKF